MGEKARKTRRAAAAEVEEVGKEGDRRHGGPRRMYITLQLVVDIVIDDVQKWNTSEWKSNP